MNYLVQPIFPEGGVHLIGAAKGVDPQRLNSPVAGSKPRRWHVPRPSIKGVQTFLRRARGNGSQSEKQTGSGGFSETVRAAAIDQVRPLTVEGMVKLMPSETEVVVIGNIGALVKNKVASDALVLALLPALRAFAGERKTIIGITDASKSYGGRGRIKGTSMWAHYSDTVVILDPGSQPDTVTAKIFPVNSKPEVVEVPLPPPIAEVRPA